MLLKNGHLIDPATRTAAPRDIRITNGIITELAQNLVPQNEEEILDLSGLTVAPGLVDTHVHFRDPGLTYKEISIPVHLQLQRADLHLSSVWQTQNLP